MNSNTTLADKGKETRNPLGDVLADIALWLLLVLLLAFFRGVLFTWFHKELTPGTRGLQIARCFFVGFRFDASIVTYALIPLAIASVLTLFFAPWIARRPALIKWHRRLRLSWSWLLVFAVVVVGIVDVGYFKEYHSQFDHWIFDMMFDDEQAIALTIWKSYPIVRLIFLMLILTVVIGWVWQRLLYRVAKMSLFGFFSDVMARIILAVILIALLVFGIRGSAGRRPVQLKDVAVCGEPFLDKIVLNPFSAYRYALTDHLAVTSGPGLEKILPGGDVRRAAQTLFPNVSTGNNLDDYLQKIAHGSKTEKPKHIYLIVMESYDAWSMQPKYDSLHFTDRLKQLGREGMMAKALVSSGHGTMPTLSSLITGLPEVGLHMNYQPSIRGGIPTSIAKIFKQLGYKTRFFYGGYLSWQRLGEFCKEQGFDEVHGGAEMTEHLSGNEWGVDDKVLFDFMLKNSGDQPTFDMVMSTSYHPPFSVNVEAEGFPLKTLPADLPECEADALTLHEYGCLWYADRSLGDFVAAATKKMPDAVFAMTGDHFSRRCLSLRPTVQEQETVPLVIYGPKVLKPILPVAPFTGSHLDIIPTLVELAAPTGFVYHAFGRNLLDPSRPPMSFGNNTVITPDFVANIGLTNRMSALSTIPLPESTAAIELASRQWQALGWWRVMKGPSLEKTAKP